MIEYDQIAHWYAKARNPEVGVPEVTRLAKLLPARAEVLDLGCGNGLPIARTLADAGFLVHGIDSSREMVRRFRQNLPQAPVLCEAAQRSELFGKHFDAVVCWGVLFHLTPDDQVRVIEKVAGRLKENGYFLFTAGEEEGAVDGEMNGVAFRYYSLGAGRYRELLKARGLEVIDTWRDPHGNFVYLARAGRESSHSFGGSRRAQG